MHDALPFLKKATNVEVAVFETPEGADLAHGDIPGAHIGLWLARHGVKVDVKHVPAKVAAGGLRRQRATSTGTLACKTTACAWLPTRPAMRPPLP